MAYGPTLYLLTSIPFFFLGGTIAAAKVMGVVSCISALVMVYCAARAHCTSRSALTLTGYAALAFLVFENMSYWDRADSHLVMCAALAILAVSRLSVRKAAAILGIVSGVAVNLKVTGLVYILPAIAIFMFRPLHIRDILLAVILGLGLAIAPFLLPQIWLPNYLLWIKAVLAHGLTLSDLVESVMFLLPMSAPLIALVLLRPGETLRPEVKVYLVAVAIAAILVTIVASKPGAGPHHYMPILPAIAYGCALLLRRDALTQLLPQLEGPSMLAGTLLFVSSVLAFVPQAYRAQLVVGKYVFQNWEYRAAAYQLKEIQAAHRGRTIGMGYSDTNHYGETFVRPLLVFWGNPYLLDGAAMMDMEASGLPVPDGTIQSMRKCSTNLWVLPHGQPFSATNYYPPHRNIFGAELRQAFFENYERTGSTSLFDLWGCRAR